MSQTEKRLDQEKIQVGDYLSEIQYYEVIGITSRYFKVKNERGLEFEVTKKIAEEGMYSASQVLETQQVTATQMAEIFSQIKDSIFTISFQKQPNSLAVAAQLKELNPDTLNSDKKLKQFAKTLVAGAERTLIGYKISSQSCLGRSLVVDLELPEGKNLRQIDHRHINCLIHQNIKYLVG